MKKIMYYWFPVIVWMAVIFFFSNRQRISVSDEFVLNFLFFKSLHVLEYSMLYVLVYRATRRDWLISFFIVICYAISDEIHQTFVPTREGRFRDVIIDSGGASLSWIFIRKLLPKMPLKLRKLGVRLDML